MEQKEGENSTKPPKDKQQHSSKFQPRNLRTSPYISSPGELGSENEKKKSSGSYGERLGQRVPDAPEGLGQHASSAPKPSL
uniref:Uncharacterized protein n=1 Tax=Solanum tuberosum TaxID=4113 RepID=M1DY94_SOLTU